MEQTQSAGGVREAGLLESAVYRPQASFGGQDLYPGVYLKAAALVHSMIHNHPFIDGNKRTAFEAMRLFLRLNGHNLAASENIKYEFVIRIAKERSFSEQRIADWLERHSKKY